MKQQALQPRRWIRQGAGFGGRTRMKPRRGRYDPGNLYPTAKACVDGIVDAGLLDADDWVHVDGTAGSVPQHW